MEELFNTWKLGAMLLDIIVGFGLPISMIMIIRKKYQIRFAVGIIGVGTYIIVNSLLCGIFDVLIYQLNLSDYLEGIPSAEAVFYGVFHGLIQFVGYYVVMRFFMRGYERKENALMFGVGLSFIDCFYYNAVGGFSNYVTATEVGEWGRESYLGRFPEEQREMAETTLNQLLDLTVSDIVGSVIFMILEMAFMIAVSILLFEATKRAGKKYLLPTIGAAIVAINLIICFRSVERLSQVAYLVLIGVVAALTGFGAYIFYTADKEEIKGKGDFIKKK